MDRPKLETIFKLDVNPVPLNIIDFNVMAHAVLHWYETKIEGSFSTEVEEKLIKGAWALAVNRGPDMLPRHTYRIVFVADQRYADTGNYWRDRYMSESAVVQKAWEDYAEAKKIDLAQTPTNYKGQRGAKSQAFWRVYNVGRSYVTEYYPFYEAEGFEADDWAGAIYRLSRDSPADSLVRKRQILLNTLDRDWSQLVDEEHKVYFANSRAPFPNEKIQERLVGNLGVIDHTKHKMGFDLDHPKNLADWKVKHGDMGDNLPPGSPKCLFDLCDANPDYCVETVATNFEEFIEDLNNHKANDRPDHFDKSMRAFAKICLEAPVKL